MKSEKMRLRFAPSPTGYIHVGNTRTLLVNWLYARRHNATFYLRFDDTDAERSKVEYEEQIIKDLAWLGITYEKVFRQSERLEIYAQAATKLKESNRLYPCYETKNELDFKRKRLLSQGRPPIYDRAALKLSKDQIESYEKEGRKPHWRFLLNDDEITWNDLAHGPLSFQGSNLSDPILVREDGTPVFTLSGMVDDMEMGITHILRGDDHITNTAIQIQILEALGGKASDFHFGHTPLLTGAQGEGLSKRLGSLSLHELRTDDFDPLAITNYLANLGLSEEMPLTFSLTDLAIQFDLQKLGKSAPKFSLEDMERTNADILHHMPYPLIQERIKNHGYENIREDFWETVKGNLTRLRDLKPFMTMCFGEISPVIEDTTYLEQAISVLPNEPWTDATWESWTNIIKEKTGRKGKELYMPLRLALTGESHGPEMKKFLPFIGYNKAKRRLSGEHA
jgi:glutamyl-tRNA synthetase